jgi:hypothetical protein
VVNLPTKSYHGFDITSGNNFKYKNNFKKERGAPRYHKEKEGIPYKDFNTNDFALAWYFFLEENMAITLL